MVTIKNRVKPWKEGRIVAKLTKNEPHFNYGSWVIRGWVPCDNDVPYKIWSGLPKEGLTDCSKCRTCGMRAVVGTRPWTKRYICPENRDNWGDTKWFPYEYHNK